MKFYILAIVSLCFTKLSGQNIGLALEGDAWASVTAFPVKGRSSHINQKLAFGPFRTLDIDRSWTRGTSSVTGITEGVPTSSTYKKIITTEHITKKQTLSFSLADSSNNMVNGYCVSQVEAKDFNIGDNPNSILNLLLDLQGRGGESSNLFYVILLNVKTQEQWELLLDNQASQMSKAYEGYLARNEREYFVLKPVSRIKNKKGKIGTMPFGSAGYQVTDPTGKPLAAVSLIDRGIVYLTDMNEDEKILLAGALTALLLQEMIE